MPEETLRIAVLGKPQLHYQGQALTADQVSAKGQALLIYLAVTRQVCSRSTLAGLLWGDMPEETARANLRLTLSKLRKFLPETILQASRLEIGLLPNGYWLDVTQFQQGLKADDKRHELYRGDFLDDFFLPNTPDFDEWAAQQRAHLRQMAIIGLTKLVEKTIAEQAWEKGIAAARQLLTIELWHEEGHRQLMLLLALSGQRSAALAQYDICRRLLDEELEVAPTSATTALYERIKAGDLEGQATSRQPPAASRKPITPSSPGNLPVQLTPFIGREAELQRLRERLLRPDYRLLTLLGEGGVGKTRLALAAAAQVKDAFSDGTWFVSLVGLDAAAHEPLVLENHIATAIAAALDIIFAAAEPPKTQLINYLRGKNCLLVLDNFEPVLAAAGFVLELLMAAPGVTILATSREPLHLQAEAIMRVTGLALPETADAPNAAAADGICLFAERTERTTGEALVTPQTLPDVLQLCRFVNGLPLGIELIASWTRWLALPAIWQGLQENAVRLETSMQDVAPRHRSLQAVFDYSWTLLSREEQNVLAQLSVFQRGFQLEAVREVIGTSPSTLFALVDKSLVQHREEGYYDLHELLRQYAAARLTDLALDPVALSSRHARYYLGIAGQQAAPLVGPQPHKALRRMQADSENLTQAWQWATHQPLPEALATGVAGMVYYWNYAGLFGEGEQALAAAAAAIQAILSPAQPEPDLCRLLARFAAERASLLFDLNRLDEMEKEARTCWQWAQLVGDEQLAAHGHLRLGQVLWRRGDNEAASDEFQQAQKLVTDQNEKVLEAVIWRNLAAVAWRSSDQKMAESACRRSLELHLEAGDERGANRSRHFLSLLALERHDYETARIYLEPVMVLAQEMGERRIELAVYGLLGQVAGFQGQYEQALAYLAQERERAAELNVLWQIGSNASNTGDVYLRLGDYAQAQTNYERSLAMFRQIQSEHAQSNVLAYLGLLACLQKQFTQGLALCEMALPLAQQTNSRREQALARLFMAHNLVGLGRWAEARQAYELAQAAWQLLHAPSRAMEAQAGNANAALHLGDTKAAAAAAHEVWTYLETNGADGMDDAARVFVTCYQVFKRVSDKRAQEVLVRGREFLHTRANRIQDPGLRRLFLENNPSHHLFLHE